MVVFHNSLATFPASKACSTPGTGGLFSASPPPAVVAQSTPLPGVSPFADSEDAPGENLVGGVALRAGIRRERASIERVRLESIVHAPVIEKRATVCCR